MKSVFSYRTTIDLRARQQELFWDTIANVGDDNAHQFVLDFVDANGNMVDLTGAEVMLYAIRPDGETVIQVGSIENNCAVASLDEKCYAYTGRVKCTLTVSKDDTIISAIRVWINVGVASTDEIVDPGEVIPTLSELLAEIEHMRSATSLATTAAANANTAAAGADTAATNANTKATRADNAADNATTKAGLADSAAQRANAAADSVYDMTASASGLPAGSPASANVTTVDNHLNIHFGIPKGDTGAQGIPGNPAAVTGMTTYYQNSTVGNVIPSGTWQTTQPVTPQGQFLWIKLHKVWNNGQETDEYSVSRMGIDGAGSVTTVMGIGPDSTGNISLATAVGIRGDTLTLTFI